MKFRALVSITAALSLAFRAFAADPAPSASPSASTSPVDKGKYLNEVDPHPRIFDNTYQFIFFATLEGLYRDGVADADVKSLLATNKDGVSMNFIYACPICMPVEGAILTYQQRPRIDHLKMPTYQTDQRTFGLGLPKEISAALSSDKSVIRLAAINTLVSQWISYRMDHSGLTEDQKANLVVDLKKRRDQGMKILHSFSPDDPISQALPQRKLEDYAPAYHLGDECAVCNGALQMPLKLKAP